MNLCIVTSSYPAYPGDVSAPFLADLAHALDLAGHRVVVVAPERTGVAKQPDGIEVRWIPWSTTGKPLVETKLTSPVELWKVYGLLRAGTDMVVQLSRERAIDVVIAMWALPAGYMAWRAHARTHLPYAVWCLGSDINSYARYPGLGRLVRQILRDATWRFADGIELAERASALAGVSCEFLPTARVLPTPHEVVHLDGRVRFLFVGRLERVKGVDVLVDAMRRFRSDDGIRLYVRGGGSLEPALRSAIAQGPAGQVVLLPPAGAAQIAADLAACDCMVIPSRSESIPVVFSEALNAGTPMIVTDVGDMGRLARENGLAGPVPAGDPEALAIAMADFAADVDGHRRRFEAARTKLREVFDVEAIARRLTAAFVAQAA